MYQVLSVKFLLVDFAVSAHVALRAFRVWGGGVEGAHSRVWTEERLGACSVKVTCLRGA